MYGLLEILIMVYAGSTYKHFVSLMSIHYNHAGGTEEESIRVEWNDHASEFNASWLRGEDIAQLPTALTGQIHGQSWDASFNPPEHVFKEGHHDANCEAWMKDLRRYGALKIHGVPPNRDGMRAVMQTFGPLHQRIHPTNIFTLKVGYASGELLDKGAYGKDPLAVHTDSSENQAVSRIEAFLCQKYSAPDGDTVSLISDGLKVAEEFYDEHPEEYKLLSGTQLRLGRFRLTTEEECPCEDQRIYQRHSVVSTPIIITDGSGRPEQVRLRHNKHIGLDLSGSNQEAYLAYYKAYKLFHDKLNDPRNLASFTLRSGTLLLFDNYRVCHGRNRIYPTTTRSMLGAYVSSEVFESRYRLLLTQQAHLEPKWAYGCSTTAMEALANRFLPQ